MKTLRIVCFAAITLVLLRNVSGQSFIDLNFEQSKIVSSNYDSEFDIYYGTAIVPGWTGYLGTNLDTTILWNNGTLGNASIDVISPGGPGGAIEGKFTLWLQQGGGNPFVSASMSQTGLVPADAQSLQFKANIWQPLSVSLGGQDLSLIQLGTGTNYTLYGADISQFAGQVEPLVFTALAGPNESGDFIDSIVFSPSSVPEPSAFSLFSICILFLSWRTRQLQIHIQSFFSSSRSIFAIG
jgi:hypothetical protein